MLSKMSLVIVFVVASAALVLGQRPFFAGSRPIGFPDTPNRTTTEGLGDRFGVSDGTTPKLPIEANGDLDLIDRLSKLPIDNQPFWFINWQALEAHRNKPQTYPQRPSVFVDSNANNQNVASTPNAQANANSDNTFGNRFGSTVSNSGLVNSNSRNNVNKLNPTTSTAASASTNSDSVGDRFEDTTEDILDQFEATRDDQVSSSKSNTGTKKPLYF